jgi:phage shock protein PspC (stress-responsive transcriptional regulator)
MGGIGIVLYIAGLIILPENPNEEATKTNKVSNSLIFGFILIAIGGFLLLRQFGVFPYFRIFDFSLATVWGLILIGIGIVLLFQIKRPATTDAEESSDSLPGEKKIYRSNSDKMLAGICGGLGQYFNIDSSIIRIGWVLATFFSVGLGILVYVILIFIFPEESTEQAG